MTRDLLSRIRHETTVTLSALHEAVIALSERATRKVQILRLHWQASRLHAHIDAEYEQLGAVLADLLARTAPDEAPTADGVHAPLAYAAHRIRSSKADLQHLEARRRELDAETLHDHLLTLQKDLSSRSLTIERVLLAPGSPAVGHTLGQLGLSSATRVIAVFRGPALLATLEGDTLRAGDLVLLLGPRAEVERLVLQFEERHVVSA
jgi:uncharacterized protein with PhoU and TrkA domain